MGKRVFISRLPNTSSLLLLPVPVRRAGNFFIWP